MIYLIIIWVDWIFIVTEKMCVNSSRLTFSFEKTPSNNVKRATERMMTKKMWLIEAGWNFKPQMQKEKKLTE